MFAQSFHWAAFTVLKGKPVIYKCYRNKHSIKRTKVGIIMITHKKIFIGAGLLLLVVIPQDLFLTNSAISVSSTFFVFLHAC